jgi:hypothetical protein
VPDHDPSPGERLDSWKAIADYLQRDVGTVRRWEKSLGLPVRRVPGGRGRSVFAFQGEIDAWLKTAPSAERSAAASAPPRRTIRPWHTWVAVGTLVGVVAMFALRARPAPAAAGPLRVEATPDAIVAYNMDGSPRWTHLFPAEDKVALSTNSMAARVITTEPAAVYAITSYSARRSDDRPGSGALMAFTPEGELRRSFSFDDEVTFAGKPYGAPWANTTFAIDDSTSRRRVAVAAHHYTWDPSLVTVLDDRWQRRATFVHAGWVEALHWLSPERLLIGGFSESRNGGMVALLDPAAMNGQGPEAPGTRYYCDSCGTERPLRMIVMPRTELNLVTSHRFNRAVVEVTADRVIARTIEVLIDEGSAADVVYEFTPSLELISAAFGARYWDLHRTLELEGKLDHPRERCPDRDGPREIFVWTPAAGWTAQKTR